MQPTRLHLTRTTGSITPWTTESSTVYASINHKLTSKLLGTVIGQLAALRVYIKAFTTIRRSDYYSLGVNLSYSFNQHFSVDAGYNYDDLTSQIPGNSYTRNRVYLGVSAAY